MAIHAPQETVDACNNPDEERVFEPLEEGLYLAKPIEVTEYEPTANGSGFGGVTVKWEVLQPRADKGRWLWQRLSWSPKAAFRIREFWDALGYEYDSDFEEPVEEGETAILEVVQEVIPSGKRKGEIGNTVDKVLEATAEAVAALSA